VPYRVGVIGLGAIWKIAWRSVLETLRDEGLVEVTIVATSNREQARIASEKFGVRVVPDYKEVAGAEDVDIVFDLAPAFVRREIVAECARAGKHLMLEKPIATNLDDARAVVEMIDKAGVKCYVPFVRGASLQGRKCLELAGPSGTLGQARVVASFGLGGLVDWPSSRAAWELDPDRNGGSMLYDYGCHTIDLARALFASEAASVTYTHSSRNDSFPSSDTSLLFCTFGNGGELQLSASWAVPEGIDCNILTGYILCPRGVVQLWARSGRLEWHAPSGTEFVDLGQSEDFVEARTLAVRELIQAIETDGMCSPNHHDGLAVAAIMDAAYTSYEKGVTVRL